MDFQSACHRPNKSGNSTDLGNEDDHRRQVTLPNHFGTIEHPARAALASGNATVNFDGLCRKSQQDSQ